MDESRTTRYVGLDAHKDSLADAPEDRGAAVVSLAP